MVSKIVKRPAAAFAPGAVVLSFVADDGATCKLWIVASCLHSFSSPTPRHSAKRQIHIAELTRALDTDVLQAHWHRQLLAVVLEKPGLFGCADQPPRRRPRLKPSMLIKLTKLRYRLLNDALANTNAAYKAPVAVNRGRS